MGAPSFKTKAKYPNYVPVDFSAVQSKAVQADQSAYGLSDTDFAARHAGVVDAEKSFEERVAKDQEGNHTLMPQLQNEFMRAGLQKSLGAFGDSAGVLKMGSAGEANVARNLGMDIMKFQQVNRANANESLSLAEQIFPRRQIGLGGKEAAAIDVMNTQNQNQYALGKANWQLGKDQFKYQGKLAAYNAWMAEKNADAAGQASQDSAMISGGAAVAGLALLLLMCWVARAAYGNNPDWMIFRQWMIDDAPGWLFNLYARHGKKAGEWVERNPRSKPVIRFFMDFAVAWKRKEFNSCLA